MERPGPDPDNVTDIAEFVGLLNELRLWAGGPSYRALAKKTGPLMRPPQQLSQSTLGEAFQPWRRRLNLDLVTAIVRALGLAEPEVTRWRAACVRVHTEAKSGGPAGVFRQLPADSADFTGRDQELARLREVVEASDTVSTSTVLISAIEGMGGVGKTQLAVHAAHEFVRSGRFGDLQLYVNLRGFDPDHAPAAPSAVLEGFLRQLGISGRHIPASLDERAAMFRDRISGKRALVLLDNALDEDQVRPLLPADSGVLVLITSRRAFLSLDGVRQHMLNVFTMSEAVALLARIAGAERIEAEPEAVAQVAELCGFLPLALALAGAKLRSRPMWTPGDLLGYLRSGGLDTISAGSGRLRAVFDLSYRGLPPRARRLFCLLGIHPGPDITVPSAAALSDTDFATALAELELLQDEHLLKQTVPGRYAFHDLVRQHAYEVAQTDLAEEERHRAGAGLLDHYISYATAAVDSLYPLESDRRTLIHQPATIDDKTGFDTPESAQGWLETEASNLVAACTSDHATRHTGRCQDLAAVLYRFLEVTGRHQDATAVHGAAANAARLREDRTGQGKALTNRAGAHWHLGNYQQAIQDNLLALELHRSAGSLPRLIGQALANLAVAYEELGRHDDALSVTAEAMAIFQEAEDRPSEAGALHNMATIKMHAGMVTEALADQTRGLAMARDIGDPILIAYSLSLLGSLHSQLGHHAEAGEHLHEALDLAEKIGHQPLLLTCLNDLGRQARGDDPGKALAYHTKALAIAMEIHDRHGQARAREGIGDSFRDLADLDRARQHWNLALADLKALNAPGVEKLVAKLSGMQTEWPPAAET